jgi:hypothetical protein
VAAQVPSEGLTPVEQSLVEHVCRGEWLDLVADDEVVDGAALRSWGDDRTCRATVIRDILRGRSRPTSIFAHARTPPTVRFPLQHSLTTR